MHEPGSHADLCFVLVHGFTGSWTKPRVARVVHRLARFGGVVAIDMRGHGRSSGASTVGRREVLDVAAAVRWARALGYRKVVSVGFSLGGAVVLREAGLARARQLAEALPDLPLQRPLEGGEVDGVVAVSAPAFWYYRGTRIMRVVHWLVETAPGRAAMRVRGTRISAEEWPDGELPTAPVDAVRLLGDTPLLVVHGDADRYFPVEHPEALHDAATRSGARSDLWLVPGFGHAESAVAPETIDRIGSWARECVVGTGG
jgi:pimeloyl-ACP methyl ester carboxylesterase